MTIIDWRNNPALVKKTAELLHDPFVIELLSAVETRPIAAVERLVGISPDDKALVLGEAIGYRTCLSQIRAMGIPIGAQTEPEPTYAVPEE